jgi:hypothetical protein
MSLPHIAAWKIGYTAYGLLVAAIYAIDPTFKVFILAVVIAAIPQTVTGIFGLMHDRRMELKQEESLRKQDLAQQALDSVGQKVDGILAKSHQDEKAATVRAIDAEAFTRGSESERERGK